MSTTIYSKKSSQKFHYIYQITEISSNRKYIGMRSSKIDPLLDLGIKYFSSSSDKGFKKRQKQNPIDYKYEILSLHSSREDCSDEEIRLHELYNVKNNKEFINNTNANKLGYDPTGMIPVRDKDGNTFAVSINDPRYLSGELLHNMVGKKLTDEHKKNISKGANGENNGFYGKKQTEYCKERVSNQYKIDGKIYRGRESIAKEYDISIRTIENRCKSEKWPSWELIKKRA